jgi:chaperonin GroEL (HSP60 family)
MAEADKKRFEIAARILKISLLELVNNMFKYAEGDKDFKTLIENADPTKCDPLDSKTWFGFDLKKNVSGNLHELGILEPTAVAIETIRSSIAVSSLLINSGAFITHSRTPATGFYNPQDWVNPS